MATRNELDAYFGGDPSYELHKKLYGGSGSNAGQINKMYDAQLEQANAYYDAQLQKLAGQNAQQQQALAADNMRAGRGIRYATTQGGLNNSGVQAQAGVLNAIAGQKAQGTLAAQYQQNVADLEADRAQQAYGLEANRQQALYDDRLKAEENKAKYASALSSYASQYDQAMAAQSALSANNLVATSADELFNYYTQLSDPNSQVSQSIINNYGTDGYNSYLAGVKERVNAAQSDIFQSELESLAAMSEADKAVYYNRIAFDDKVKDDLINRIGEGNYNTLVKQANAATKAQRRTETMNELVAAFSDPKSSVRQKIGDYYNKNYAYYNKETKENTYVNSAGMSNELFADIIREMIQAGDELIFGAITASDLATVLKLASPNRVNTALNRARTTTEDDINVGINY